MTRLRIAHVLSSFRIGGQERVALDLARAHRALGHEVYAFSIDAGPEGPLGSAFRDGGIETATLPKGPRVDPTLVLRLALHLARRRIAVVHTHNPLAMAYGAPAGKLVRAAVVHTKHGENLEPHARRVVLRRLVATLTDVFVAVSETTARAALAARDVGPAKLRVVPNGIDVTRFGASTDVRAEVRRELGIPLDAWVVGAVGRLVPEKNQALLVRALAPGLDATRRLVLVGDGPEAPTICREIEAARVGPYVHRTGARGDVPRLLAAFDVFALPSVSEGLPLVVLEAMATGLPVVASAVGGLPTVVEHGETGLLVPSGDPTALRTALLTLARDAALARRLGERARRVVAERHSLERMRDAYLGIYLEVVEGAATRRRDGSPTPRELS